VLFAVPSFIHNEVGLLIPNFFSNPPPIHPTSTKYDMLEIA